MITKIDTLYLPGDVVYRDTTIYKPAPYRVEVAPEVPPALYNYYSDTVVLNNCEVVYDAQVHGLLQHITLRARRTTSQVIKISETRFEKQEVERKVYPNQFYLGAGIGGSRRQIDDVSVSALFSTHKNAYSLDYNLVDRSLQAKVYFKLF